MSSMIRAMALGAALSTWLLGCGTPPGKTDGGPTGGGGGNNQSCVVDDDCPSAQFFACSAMRCVPKCRVKDDCSDSKRGQYALPECSGTLGCQCDEGRCAVALCSADSDCGANVCRNGACVAPPAASTVAKCQITPDFVVAKAGTKVTFWVSFWDAANKPVVAKDSPTWSLPSGSPLMGTGSGTRVELDVQSAAAAGAAVDAVQAALGSATCKAKVSVVAAGSTGVTALVIDELTGRPIENVDVVVADITGAITKQSGNDSVKTGANGVANLPTLPSGEFSVSAFHADYGYVTFARYAGTGDNANFLMFALRRNQTDKYGGFKGTFKDVSQTSDVHVGITSMSVAGAINDLSLEQLAGPSEDTRIKLSTVFDDTVPVPSGVYMGLGSDTFKPNVSGQGLAGVCSGSNETDRENKIRNGECGTRTAWALTGDVPINQIISAVEGGTENLDIQTLLGQVIPLFKKFNSSVVRDVEFSLVPTPLVNGKPNFLERSHFTAVDQGFSKASSTDTSVPLSFSSVLKLPDLPQYNGTYADGALVLGGVYAPGRGVVPLGMGIAVNTTPKDGKSDVQGSLVAPGLMQVRMAPSHHGLEGNEYGMLILALSAAGLSDSSAGFAFSAIFPRVPNNALVFDPDGKSPIDFSQHAFPVFGERAKFNYSNTAGVPAPRSFVLASATAPTGVEIGRVVFVDDRDHRWQVLLDASKLQSGFTLPKPPAPHVDRIFANGMQGGSRSSLAVQLIRLRQNPQAANSPTIAFNELIEFNSYNTDRFTEHMDSYSYVDFGSPEVEFDDLADNATVAAGSAVKIVVTGFRIGESATSDGVVRVSFSKDNAPVTACPDAVVKVEDTAGSGKLTHTLATGCNGTGLKIKATLVGINGTTPLDPEVSAEQTINITP